MSGASVGGPSIEGHTETLHVPGGPVASTTNGHVDDAYFDELAATEEALAAEREAGQ